MSKLLMPKATAVWLVENTTLTFGQIAKFCEMHELEVKGIADGDVAIGVAGLNPILSGQLLDTEIKRCEADPATELQMVVRDDLPEVKLRAKGPRFTSMTKRTEKPDAIAWLVKNYPAMSDAAIGRLLATTKDTIASIRDRTHWNIANIKPQNPVLLGLFSQAELDKEVGKIRVSRIARVEAARVAEEGPAEAPAADSGANNPFAAALAAYAKAAKDKMQPTKKEEEPTVESVFGSTDRESDRE
jgi:hypothetical protein